MDYFSKFLRPSGLSGPKPIQDHLTSFEISWTSIKGIKSTDVPANLKVMVDILVLETTRTEEGGTGACLEYLLKNDVLGTLVKLSEADRPSGIQVEVLRAVQNMVILLDEQFLVHSVVHKAVLRLLRNCVGDDIQEQLDNRNRKVMGAAKNAVRSSPSEYEEDLVNLLSILCSRIRTFRELLMIFFHDKHWHHTDPPLSSVEEEDEDDDEEYDSDDSGDTQHQSDVVANSGGSTAEAPETLSHDKKPEYEFLLFNYLLRFVHREGQIGDFARAGLLFLMDVAMSPGDQEHRLSKDESAPFEPVSEPAAADAISDAALSLAEYVLDGDFSDVLGAGLGAVYSQLPSKLEVHVPSIPEEIEGQAWYSEAGSQADIQERRDFKTRLDHFLRLLEFLQDIFQRNVLQENPSPSRAFDACRAIRQTFLENVLYPSILECSDSDGSAVAVMSYIEIMIRTLEKGQLTDLLVNFLASEDNDDVPKSRPRPHSMLTLGGNAQKKLRRRRSSAMILLELEAPESTKQSDYFTSLGRFTLKDLLISNLRSQDQPTAAAALQLLNTLLVYCSPLCVDKLLIVIRDPKATSYPEPAFNNKPRVPQEDDDTFVYPGEESPAPGPVYVQPRTTYSTHEREIDLYLRLVSRLDPVRSSDSFSTGYDRYLCDATQAIRHHSTSSLAIPEETQAQMKHRLDPNDPILSALFSNSPEFNIVLTGLLASLAHDPLRSLAGWLTSDQSDDASVAIQSPVGGLDLGAQEDGDDRSTDYPIEEMLGSGTRAPASSLDDGSRPVILTIFQSLVSQLERYRHNVENFDKYLLERRQGLLFSENLTDALTLALDLDDANGAPSLSPPVATTPITGSPPNPTQRIAGPFINFLTPRKPKPHPQEPFGSHYQHTGAVAVEPFEAPSPSQGPWTPARPLKFSAEEEDVFSSAGRTIPEYGQVELAIGGISPGPKTVTLSRLLDNIVILEESIKEMAAIIQARRALGVDAVRFI
ncbi:Retinoic acid induced 16-like protein-domain-containing protein [Lactifluus volemus]|nr:Retinoic acid induced 16-like protein-domain-containing protein [Lactifluus volemus]